MDMLLNSSRHLVSSFERDKSFCILNPLKGSFLDQLIFHSGSFLNFPFKIDEALLKQVVSDYTTELENKEWFLDVVSKKFLDHLFGYTISKLIVMNPSFIGVELTHSDSLFIISKIAGCNVHLEIFLDKEVIEQYDVVINVFQDGEQILSQIGDIDDSINHLESVLPKETRSLLNLINSNDNSLSRNSLTETSV